MAQAARPEARAERDENDAVQDKQLRSGERPSTAARCPGWDTEWLANGLQEGGPQHRRLSARHRLPGGGQARAGLVRCPEHLVWRGRPATVRPPAGGGPATSRCSL